MLTLPDWSGWERNWRTDANGEAAGRIAGTRGKFLV